MWTISHMSANDYGGVISIAVAKDNPWPWYGTQGLGTTGTGLNVYLGNGAGDGLEKYLKRHRRVPHGAAAPLATRRR